MSWLARSIANSLKFNEENDGDGRESESTRKEGTESKEDGESPPISPSRGVKDDLSELSRTLTRQFRGFTTFLAPPAQSEHESEPNVDGSDKGPALGIRGDFAEIGGRFRSEISRISNNINVAEITKMASSLLQLEVDDENENKGKDLKSPAGGAVGVTQEVVAFVSDISTHPETWLDFPLPLNDGDFDMSDEQQEHALAVERHVPNLAALRMRLSPRYMSDDRFWKIYFVIVHTRLRTEDALLLSTPQVMEARALLASDSKNSDATKQDESVEHEEESITPQHQQWSSASLEKSSNHDIDVASELQAPSAKKAETLATSTATNTSKSGINEQTYNPLKLAVEEDEDDVDGWLRDEATESSATVSKTTPTPVHNDDDDVTFSDLEEEEDDDDEAAQSSFRKPNYSSDDKDTRDWVQLGKSSSSRSSKDKLSDSKESSDWLDVDDMIVP